MVLFLLLIFLMFIFKPSPSMHHFPLPKHTDPFGPFAELRDDAPPLTAMVRHFVFDRSFLGPFAQDGTSLFVVRLVFFIIPLKVPDGISLRNFDIQLVRVHSDLCCPHSWTLGQKAFHEWQVTSTPDRDNSLDS
jgi:hypothetical protein